MADLSGYQVHVTYGGGLVLIHEAVEGCAAKHIGIPGRRQFVSVSNILKAVNEHQHTEHPRAVAEVPEHVHEWEGSPYTGGPPRMHCRTCPATRPAGEL